MMKKGFLYFDKGDYPEADLVNAFLTPVDAAEIVPCPKSVKGDL